MAVFSLKKRAQTKMYNKLKNKHLTLDDHIEIQEYLSKVMTFKSIAYFNHCSLLTSKERILLNISNKPASNDQI